MSILIIDDEEILQDVLTSLLRSDGFSTLNATTAQAGLDLLAKEDVDLVLLDLMLPDMSGIEVLKRIRAEDPDQVVVVITAFSSIEGAIEAMREGAFHYIPKCGGRHPRGNCSGCHFPGQPALLGTLKQRGERGRHRFTGCGRPVVRAPVRRQPLPALAQCHPDGRAPPLNLPG